MDYKEKITKVLSNIGFNQDEIASFDKEDVNVDDVVNPYKERIATIYRDDENYINPIKQDAKSKGLAEAFLKAKKAINTNYGLGLSNKDLDEIDIEDLTIKAKEMLTKPSGKESDELNKLTQDLFSANKKIEETQTLKDSEILQLKETYENRINSILIQDKLLRDISKLELIVSFDEAQDFFMAKLSKLGITLKSENNTIVPYKGNGILKNEQGTNYELIDNLISKLLNPLIKKSGKSGEVREALTNPDGKGIYINPTLKAQLEREGLVMNGK